MGARLGFVGLPNAGKSTLFNALTAGHAATAAYPFTTTDPNVGVAVVEDPRLGALAARLHPHRVVPTTLECVDLAGLVKGAHRGEGLGNQFLSHILGVDALVHVVRCFEEAQVAHPMGAVDPIRDLEVVGTELLLKDLELVGRRKDKEQKLAKGGAADAQRLLERLAGWEAALSGGRTIRQLHLAPGDHPAAFGIDCLTAKPVVYVGNVGERAARAGPDGDVVNRLRAMVEREGAAVILVCAKLEAELAELAPADRPAMMRELGLVESALPRVIRRSYAQLRLVTFFTTVSGVLQAWTVPEGTRVRQAAGVIHSDFERGFVRAEVIDVNTLVACGSEVKARAEGRMRLEGKEYVVRDGDVIHIRAGT